MNPKSGKAGSSVDPTEPKKAEEADKADPGEVEQIKAEQLKKKSGKYGSEQTKPYKAPETKEEKEKKKAWIAVEMIDEEKNPVPGLRYKITLPDDTVAEGTLDDKGYAKVEGIEPGSCKITFPDLDKEAWEPA